MNQNSVAVSASTELTADRIDRGLEWLKHSLPLLNECADTNRKAMAAVMTLSEPAHPAKVMARVLALLNPYFDKDTPQAIRQIEAEDWAVALGQYPYWAIERAARWWKSDANPDRRKRPLEGDISGRCRREMDAVNAARLRLENPVSRPAKQDTRESVSQEQQDEMRKRMAELGNQTLEAMRRNIGKKI